ncbi:MAG: hypothetical protein IJ634_07085 [Bacteroidales bacterium]|nr:hypothetical protein [Bacteroidales bacterium]
MKRHVHIIALLLLSLLSLPACSRKEPSEAMTAARAMYERYANINPLLTVAFIGDYHPDPSSTYNAVMFHADDDTTWQWIQHEFGINDLQQVLPPELIPGDPSNIIVSSMFIVPDSAEYVHLMSHSPCDSDIDLMQALAQLLHIEMDSQKLHILLSDPADLPDQMVMQTAVGEFALQHQQHGFLVSSEQDTRTLWLFFYSDEEEEQAIIRILENQQHNK